MRVRIAGAATGRRPAMLLKAPSERDFDRITRDCSMDSERKAPYVTLAALNHSKKRAGLLGSVAQRSAKFSPGFTGFGI